MGNNARIMARRLSLDEPSLTLTYAPAQKQTERCHPLETRPLTVREYARIQTFPDNWDFQGTMSAKYKQIGNAVPVNLAWAVGRSLIRLFNDIERIHPSETQDCRTAVNQIVAKCLKAKDNTIGQLRMFEETDSLPDYNLNVRVCEEEEAYRSKNQ